MHLGNLDYVRGDTDESSQLKDTNQAGVLAKVIYYSHSRNMLKWML